MLPGAGLRLAGSLWAAPARPADAVDVVLVPGGGQTRHAWRHAARALARDGRNTLALDLRGHGESDWDDGGDYTIEAFAGDVTAVLRSLPAPPAVVGASVGALASLHALGSGPGLATALVLLDAAPTLELAGVDGIAGFMRGSAAGFGSPEEASAYLARHGRGTPDPRRLARTMRRRDGRWFWHWDPRLVEYVRGEQHTAATGRPDDGLAAAARVRVPALVVRGGESDVVSAESAAALAAALPDSRLVTLPGIGHMRPGDDNDAFAAVLVAFLAEVADPR
jgi:pimeloyl-ACP methyl ester carboxylesterase